MKRRYLIFVFLLLACIGCNDWLDVRPRNEMKEETLYATEDGFKNALTGVYILMAESDLYGKNASMYIPEMLARHWTLPVDKTKLNYHLANYDYSNTDVESVFDALWKKYYKCIVHLNNILGNLEKSDVAFTCGNKQLIKGEALGLRAFLHLELLRLFGPIPEENIGDAPAIPYAEEMTKDPAKLQTLNYREVCGKIIRDLDAAEKELEKDPIITGTVYNLNHPSQDWEGKPEDDWQFYRQVRFNYYAVKGAKARFYHWIGDAENAVKCAKEVVEAKNDSGLSKFELASESTMASNTLVFLNEHLFGVHNPDLQTIVQSLYKDENPQFTQTVKNIDAAYEVGVHPLDIRYKKDANRYWEEKQYQNSSKCNHFRKYTGNDDYTYENIVPLLRLAEMYLILIEDLSLEQGLSYFKTYRISRGLDVALDESLHNTNDVRLRLEKEYRKEFYGEGQMFFFYKKHNYTAYTWPAALTLPGSVYNIPIPDSQRVFD